MKNGEKHETVGTMWLYQLRMPGQDHPDDLVLIGANTQSDAQRIAAELLATEPGSVKGLRRITNDAIGRTDFKRQRIHVIRHKNSALLPEYRLGEKNREQDS